MESREVAEMSEMLDISAISGSVAILAATTGDGFSVNTRIVERARKVGALRRVGVPRCCLTTGHLGGRDVIWHRLALRFWIFARVGLVLRFDGKLMILDISVPRCTPRIGSLRGCRSYAQTLPPEPSSGSLDPSSIWLEQSCQVGKRCEKQKRETRSQKNVGNGKRF